MSDAQLVLAFVFGAQTSTLDDKKAALALAKGCPAEVTAIGAAMGKQSGWCARARWGDPRRQAPWAGWR